MIMHAASLSPIEINLLLLFVMFSFRMKLKEIPILPSGTTVEFEKFHEFFGERREMKFIPSFYIFLVIGLDVISFQPKGCTNKTTLT